MKEESGLSRGDKLYNRHKMRMWRNALRVEWLPVTLLFAASLISAQAQQIAFTWDDLPAHSTLPPGETRVEIGRKIIVAMKARFREVGRAWQ